MAKENKTIKLGGRFAGQVTKDGNPVEGATVRAYSHELDRVFTAVTGSDGKYLLKDLYPDFLYHVTVEHDDGTDQYHAESLPFLETVGVVTGSILSGNTIRGETLLEGDILSAMTIITDMDQVVEGSILSATTLKG